MGQSASKGATRAAQRVATAPTRKPPQQPQTPGLTNVPPPPTSNISASAAAAEASAKVRPPSFDAQPSPRDLAQQEFLKQGNTKGSGGAQDFQEMPDELVKFLSDAGPLHKQERATTSSGSAKREPRLPRQPWQQQEVETSSSASMGSGSTRSERRQESMPLAQKIEGFETNKSTSFSRSTPEINPKIYQKGTTLDLYRLLSLKSNGTNQSPSSFDSIVQQTYAEYSKEAVLPDETEQSKHKELLKNTLKYMDLPVIMKDYKDNMDSYDGIHPKEVEVYEMMKYDVLPKDKVRLVLEDLYQIEQQK